MGFNIPESGMADDVQDITEQPLPPLYPEDAPASGVSDVGAVSTVPGADIGDDPAPTPDLPPVDDDQTEVQRSRNRRSASERIAQLTRRYRDEQEQRGVAETMLENQARQITALQQQISRIGTPPPVGAPASHPGAPQPHANDLFGDADPAAPAPAVPQAPGVAPAGLTRDDVRSVLREVVQEQTLEHQKQLADQQRLQQAHEEAFGIASEDFPELTDQNSTARRLFNELYGKSPIRNLPDAPLQIALQVRGILADSRSPRDTDQAKRQMAGIVPTPTGAAELGESQIAQARKRVGQLQEAIRQGDTSFNTYRELRQLRTQLNAARRR